MVGDKENRIMAEKGRTAAIVVGAGAALVGAYLLATRVKAKPPKDYICPYCGAEFHTYEELVAHVQTQHPVERIPIDIDWR